MVCVGVDRERSASAGACSPVACCAGCRCGRLRDRCPVASKSPAWRQRRRAVSTRPPVHDHLDSCGLGEVATPRLVESAVLSDRTSLDRRYAGRRDCPQRRAATGRARAPRHPSSVTPVLGWAKEDRYTHRAALFGIVPAVGVAAFVLVARRRCTLGGGIERVPQCARVGALRLGQGWRAIGGAAGRSRCVRQSMVNALMAKLRGVSLLERCAIVGAGGGGAAGAITGLVVGLLVHAQTAWFAVFEAGIPGSLLGGLVGTTVAVVIAAGRRIARSGMPSASRARRGASAARQRCRPDKQERAAFASTRDGPRCRVHAVATRRSRCVCSL